MTNCLAFGYMVLGVVHFLALFNIGIKQEGSVDIMIGVFMGAGKEL
jgi:hypothetical protein